MVRLHGETALPGSLPAIFHDVSSIYLFLQIRISRISEPGFRDYIFHISVVGTPVYTENQKNGADSKKRRFVNSIQELFYLNCSRVKFKRIFFIKFM